MINELIAAIKRAVDEVRTWPAQRVLVCHHNDADGLSCGAILHLAFERAGYEIDRCCLEKPYPPVLKRIFANGGELIVLADFGGRIAPLISELNQGQNLVLILDHHKAREATDERVHNLDPELYGLHGDRDISAATTCYLFACALDPANQDLARIAVIGAVGDGFLVDGRLAGPNRDAALETERQGLLRIEQTEEGERYVLTGPGPRMPCLTLARQLDTLGAAGYTRGGPSMGVGVCVHGHTHRSLTFVDALQAEQESAFALQRRRMSTGGLISAQHIQWQHVGDRFRPMGVKMIGAFLETIVDSALVDPDRYQAGFQNIPNLEVPGFGWVRMDHVKISMRVSSQLADRIRSGQAPGLDTFLSEATDRLGGFVDACHSLSAATTVGLGLEERLIEEMEKILGEDG